MNAALVPGQRVNLVHDHGAHRAQDVLCPGAGEYQVERFGRGDQDVGRVAEHGPPLPLGRVAGPDRYLNLWEVEPQVTRFLANPGQGRAQVALNVVVQRFQGGDVDDAYPRRVHRLVFGRWVRRSPRQLPKQLVNTPQERRQGLAGAGRSQDERVVAALNGRPALSLRWRGLTKRLQKPLPDRWGKSLQDLTHMKGALDCGMRDKRHSIISLLRRRFREG